MRAIDGPADSAYDGFALLPGFSGQEPRSKALPMTIDAKTIRCEHDAALFKTLLDNREVKRANVRLEQIMKQGPLGTRRRLLSSSVRLSERMAPDFRAMADECGEKLGLELPLELYVYSSAQFNAACFKPEEGRLFVMFSSSLLEGFDAAELRFVMGHELGHHVYRHHDVPIGYMLKGERPPSPRLALNLFAWSRYAEVSADRAGAHCAQDFEATARALFKLASGLTTDRFRFSLDDFLNQVREMQLSDGEPGKGAPQEDWFSTHPFSPLRVKALQHYHESQLAGGNSSKKELELAVQGLMSLMEPSYIEGRTDDAEIMRRVLFSGAIAVANAVDGISEQEVAVFEKFFGEGSFSDSLNIEKIIQEMPARTAKARANLSVPQRMQVLRDLCTVARAEGKAQDAERQVLLAISSDLEVGAAFIEQVLTQPIEPD